MTFALGQHRTRPAMESEPTCPTQTVPVTSRAKCESYANMEGRSFNTANLPNYPRGCSDRIAHPRYAGVWWNEDVTGSWDQHQGFTGEVALVCERQTMPPPTIPKSEWDLSGDRDFVLQGKVKTEASSTVYFGTKSEGKWKPGSKVMFLRDGKVQFDIGWVGTMSCDKIVNDGQWHDVALEFTMADRNKYQLVVDDMTVPCSIGLRPTKDVPMSVFSINTNGMMEVDDFTYVSNAVAVPTPAPFLPKPDWDLSGDHDFVLSAKAKSGISSVYFGSKNVGAWQPGGKVIFLRDGKLAFGIGWEGLLVCEKTVSDGFWHDIAVKFRSGMYQLFVDDMTAPCITGLKATPDVPNSSFSINTRGMMDVQDVTYAWLA